LGQAKTLLQDGAALLPQTESFAKSFAARDTMGLVSTLVPMEKWKRDQLIPALQQWTEILENALTCRCGLPAANSLAKELSTRRSARELSQAIEHLQKCTEYAQGNISPAAICGYLQWALR
jgi:hypothetical protein